MKNDKSEIGALDYPGISLGRSYERASGPVLINHNLYSNYGLNRVYLWICGWRHPARKVMGFKPGALVPVAFPYLD